jgi:cytochrome c
LVSLLGLFGNRINPFRVGALDLMTVERFRDFELSIDWNHVRIVVRGQRIEDWSNDEMLLEGEQGSDEWERAIADSKFAEVEGFGLAPEGHILLQDPGDPVWYRNIKVRIPVG